MEGLLDNRNVKEVSINEDARVYTSEILKEMK